MKVELGSRVQEYLVKCELCETLLVILDPRRLLFWILDSYFLILVYATLAQLVERSLRKR